MMESITEHGAPQTVPTVDETSLLSMTFEITRDPVPSVTDASLTTESIVSSSIDPDDGDEDDADDTSGVTENKHHPFNDVDDTIYPPIRPPPLIYGHRGALYQELENTRSSFHCCAEMGCDGIELDVFVLKCGTVVVFHGCGSDKASGLLHNYCSIDGIIGDFTYEQVKEFQFNASFTGFVCPVDKVTSTSSTIPTLEEVLLDSKQWGLHVKIELKGPGTVEPSLEIVERLDMVDQVSFSSFYHDRIALLRQLRPQLDEQGKHIYRTGALFSELPEDFIERSRKAGATDIHLRYDTCSCSNVELIHNAGFGSLVWMRGPITMANDFRDKFWDIDCENEDMYKSILNTGVQMVCVNKPDIMLKLRDELDHRISAQILGSSTDGRTLVPQYHRAKTIQTGAGVDHTDCSKSDKPT